VKKGLGINVYEAAKQRISWAFDNSQRQYVSFSGGKDSTVMLHIVAEEARKRNVKIGLLFVDLEAQYKLTIEHVESLFDQYSDIINPYWISLPLHLRNAVSVYEPHWLCWDDERQLDWVRDPSKYSITDHKHFDFFQKGMEFEEFVPLFGEWYSKDETTACFVGIRSDESLNRWRTISSTTKARYKDQSYTTVVTPHVFNCYPIYDWKTEDLWIYHAKNPDKRLNELYNRMHLAGLTIHQMRICQPYGDDQRRGLWLYHLIEPETWAKVVARVNGANSGALYIQENGNVNGYRKISKPEHHTWKSFAQMLVKSMPPKTRTHYEAKIMHFQKWWIERGYPEGIPDEADYRLEQERKVPSWRRVCKSLLRNDYWCKGLSFTQHKSSAYEKYLALASKRKNQMMYENLPITLFES
jgi:predicted phosphoadenosine phosphosulfate sulfurtransferase